MLHARAHAGVLALALGALAVTMACTSSYRSDADMQPKPGQGYVVETTGAVVGFDDPANTNDPELSLDQAAGRVAGQICAREVLCHGDADIAGACVANYLERARAQLVRWKCSPAAARARLKECLTSIRNEPCGYDLSQRRPLCGKNEDCPTPGARNTPVGAALADAGL